MDEEHLQEALFNISSETIDDMVQLIVRKGLMTNANGVKQVIHDIKIAAKFRRSIRPFLSELLIKLNNYDPDHTYKRILWDELTLYKLFNCDPEIYTVNMVLLRALTSFKYGNFYTFQEIIDLLVETKKLNDEKSKKSYQVLITLLVLWFYPEINKKDPKMSFNLIIYINRNMKYHTLYKSIEYAIRQLNSLKKIDQSMNNILDYYEHGYSPNTLEYYIAIDDVGSFQEKVSQSPFKYDEKIPFSIFDPIPIMKDEPNWLQFAALYGSIKCFKYLWLNGADQTDINNVKYAVAGGNTEIIRIFEQNNCEFDDEAFYTSFLYHQYDIQNWLYQFQPKLPIYSIHNCVISNNIGSMMFCIEEGININSYDSHGNTPLILAVKHMNHDVLHELLKSPNIDVNQLDTSRTTSPLIEACSHDGCELIVEKLLRHPQILVNQKNAYSQNALYVAIQKQLVNLVRLLLNAPKIEFVGKSDHNYEINSMLSCKFGIY